jgi:hypothetical protein
MSTARVRYYRPRPNARDLPALQPIPPAGVVRGRSLSPVRRAALPPPPPASPPRPPSLNAHARNLQRPVFFASSSEGEGGAAAEGDREGVVVAAGGVVAVPGRNCAPARLPPFFVLPASLAQRRRALEPLPTVATPSTEAASSVGDPLATPVSRFGGTVASSTPSSYGGSPV